MNIMHTVQHFDKSTADALQYETSLSRGHSGSILYKSLDIKWFIEILLTGSSEFPVSECHVNKIAQSPILLVETTVSTAKGAGTEKKKLALLGV